MKEEKPKLVLNKRTVAHLNNLEMTHVRGGDGDDSQSVGICGDKDKINVPDPKQPPSIPTAIKTVTTIFLTKVFC